MTFQKTVVVIALVMLVLVLVVIGYALYTSKTNDGFPPVLGDCPDYWIANNDGTNNLCLNVKNLGRNECAKTMNFNVFPWLGNDGLCNKSKWARSCDLTWDGITNNTDTCSKQIV